MVLGCGYRDGLQTRLVPEVTKTIGVVAGVSHTSVKAAREFKVVPFMTWNQNSKICRTPAWIFYQRGSSRMDNLELFRVNDSVNHEIFCVMGCRFNSNSYHFAQLCHHSDRR
jgi:hypothetical protein